jgi:hypothetical protein
MPEKLKSADELLDPDHRIKLWVLFDPRSGEHRPLTLEDFHQSAARIQLNATVPEPIRDHFTTALHLGVYSWFVYRFTMLSQQQAYATLEWALRERLGASSRKRRPSYAELLKEALATGLLRGRQFRRWTEVGGDPSDDEAADAWLLGLTEMIREFRNELAHGSWQLIPMHWTVLGIVADAVNQLFPQEDAQTSL